MQINIWDNNRIKGVNKWYKIIYNTCNSAKPHNYYPPHWIKGVFLRTVLACVLPPGEGGGGGGCKNWQYCMWHYENNLNWTSQKDSPESFHKGDAKSLRWICIVSLNRSYKGGGEGETNKQPTTRKQTVLSIGKVEQTQWNSVLSLRNTGGTTEDV